MNEAEDELLILDYLDGRLDAEAKARFEARMERDPALKEKVTSSTRSVELVRHALTWVTPTNKFDDKVSSKIIEITKSSMKPAMRAKSGGNLTSDDPDAKLLSDPTAAKEQRRLVILAVAAAAIFALAIWGAMQAMNQGHNVPPDVQTKSVKASSK